MREREREERGGGGVAVEKVWQRRERVRWGKSDGLSDGEKGRVGGRLPLEA